MNVLIVGGGNLGFYLARNLLESGYKVSLIEESYRRCEEISDDLNISVICGDGTNLETLSKAKANAFDAMIAVTGKDEDNLIACELAKKQFGVKKVLSRSNNPKNIALMKKLGIDIVVNTTQIITNLIEHEIDGASVHAIAKINNSDAVISEYTVPEKWSKSGTRVMDLEIPENCLLIYILRSGVLTIPKGNTLIMAGDEVVALAVGTAGKKLKKLFEI